MNAAPVKVALLGVGFIGADLLVKIRRSPWLECTLVSARNRESVGMHRAAAMGYATTDGGIDALVERAANFDLVFDATDAVSHKQHWQLLEPLGKKVIDLTPSGIGHMVVPSVNAADALRHINVNLISCGGQIAIPILTQLSRGFSDIRYIELVTTASSPSVGRSTRLNLDEYVQTTESAIRMFTGIKEVKTLVNISPANPPPSFRITMIVLVSNADPSAVKGIVRRTVDRMRSYAPGCRLVTCEVMGGERIFITVELQGRGDLLPKYAGNLDIINDVAIEVAKQYTAARPPGRSNIPNGRGRAQ